MNQTNERLDFIEKNGYQIDFSNIFNHAFENYKKIAIYAGLVLFVFSVLFFLILIASMVSFIDLETLKNELNPEKLKIENLSNEKLLTISALSLVFNCLFAPFNASFLKMAKCADKDEEFHISDLFSYYNLPFIFEIIISTFLISTLSLGQSFLFNYINLSFIGTLIQWFLSFITILSIPLIVFGELKALQSIKYSIRIVLKQPIVLLGLIVIAVIGSFVGFIGCCIGVLFTLPFLHAMIFSIYHEIIGFEINKE